MIEKKPVNQVRIYSLACIVTVLLLFSPVTADQNGTVLIALYASGNTLEQVYGLITDDISQTVKGAG
ncbi:MAG: hypothetical protein LUQ07_06470, partial [Methanospirillum sp.]|nr:hypothetical protein [Methanospirillum sp.]